MGRKSVSAIVGTVFIILVLLVAVLGVLAYSGVFSKIWKENLAESEVQTEKLKEILKLVPQDPPVILVRNAWNRDSVVRYIVVLDVNDVVQTSVEVNVTVPAGANVLFDLNRLGIPYGSKYLFVTLLGNSFGPVSFTYTLIVYVYRDGTNVGVQGAIVRVDDSEYVTDANGMVSTLVSYGAHVIGIEASNPAGGVQLVFTRWSDSSTDNPRTFLLENPTVLMAYAKVQYYLTMQVTPSNGGTVSPGSGWHDAGEQVQITATPNSGFQFNGWIGTGAGSYTGANNPATIVMNGPITETANFVETATVTFSVYGMASDASGTVLVVDGVGYSFNQLPVSFVWTVGSSHSFSWNSPVSAGTGKRYVWTSTSGLSTSQSGTINVPLGGGTVAATYNIQYTVTIQTTGLPSDFTGNSIVFDGVGYRVYDGNPATVWVASGRTIGYTWTSPINSNTAGKRYVITSSQSGNVVVDSPKTVSATYKTQYYLTVNSAYDSPNPVSGWFDAGSSITASVSSPVSGGSGIQYVCTGWSGTGSVPSSGSSTSVQFTINAPSSITWNWKTQYYLTVNANPAGAGTVSPSSGWYDAGIQLQISAVPASNYRFSGWSGSGSGSYTGTSNPATITMNGPISETANFVQVGSVTFSVSGMSSDAAENILTVDGVSYSYSQLPLSFVWDVGSSHTFSWSGLVSAGSGKRYVWVSTSGIANTQSGTIVVPSGGGSVTATYKTQYYLTVSSAYDSPTPSSGWFDSGTQITASVSSPVSGGTGIRYVCTGWTGSGSVPSSGSSTSVQFTITTVSSITWNWKTQYYLTMNVNPSGAGTVSPGSGWYDSGSQVQISATPSANYRFDSWSGSGTGSYTGTSNPATVTMNSPISETANFVQIATVTFSVTGMSSDASGTVLTVDGVSYSYSQLPKSFTWDVGTQHSFTWTDIVSAGSGKRYVWISTSGLSTLRSGTINVPVEGGSVSASYKAQYTVTLQTSGLGSDFSGNSLTFDGVGYRVYDGSPANVWVDSGRTVSYAWSSPIASSTNGKQYVITSAQSGNLLVDSAKTLTGTYKTQYYLTMQASPSNGGTVSPSSGWYDAGSNIQISATPASGYAFNGWSGSGPGSYSGTNNPATITMNGPITETALFGQTVTVTFSANGLGSDASGTVLVVDSVSYSYSQLPLSFVWAKDSQHTFEWVDPVSAGTGKRYVWVSTSGLTTSRSGTITASSSGSVTASYKTQYYLTMQVSPSGGGTVSPSSGWYDSGTQLQISATPSSGYRFGSWSGSGSGSYSGTNNPATVTMNGPITETANFIQVATVTFSASGMSSDASGTVLTVDGVSYSYSQLPKSFTWDVGTSHTFSWNSPVSAGTGKQYVWISTSGLSSSQSGTIVVPSGGGSVTATYKTQYYLTMQVNPSGGGTVSPASGWYDSGTQVQISASANSGYAFDAWSGSGSGSYSGASNPATVTMNGPITETAYFFTFTISVNPSSGTVLQGGSVSATVTVTYSSGLNSKTISFTVSGLPTGATASFSPSSVTISPSTTTASTSMTITASSSTPTGTYSLQVTGSGGGVSKVTGFSLTVKCRVTFYIRDDAGNTVSGATLNFAGTSYSDNSYTDIFSGTYSLSTGTVPSGYRFVQWETSGSVTVASSSSSSTTATVSGTGSITMRLYRTATVTFSVNGMSSDASGTVLTVDGNTYSYSSLPKSFTWDVGSSHTFSWSSPVSAGSGKQYVWVSTSGLSSSQSGTIVVPSGGGSVTATYKTQYYLTVSSAYGSPTPTSGWYDAGTYIIASVSSPVSGGTGIQYVCTGWTGTGSVPSSGSSTSVQFTISMPSSITWNWKTQYYLTIQSNPYYYGTVSPSSGWYDAGTQVQISAVPYQMCYTFNSWSGSGSGSYTGSANPVTITVNGPITETATFSTLSSSTAGSSTSADAVSCSFQRKILYANGYWWLFYGDGSGMYYTTSVSGGTWSTPRIVPGPPSPGGRAYGPDFILDGNTVYFVWLVYTSSTYEVYFEKGTLSGATISDFFMKRVYSSANYVVGGGIAKGSDGRLWVAFQRGYLYAYWSADDGQTWTQTNLGSFTSSTSTGGVSLVSLTDGKIMLIAKDGANGLYYSVWTGSSWGTLTYLGSVANGWGGFSAVSDGDTVHLVYLRNDGRIVYRKYSGSWSGETVLEYPNSLTSFPVISIDYSTKDLHVIWLKDVYVYCKKYINSIGKWDSTVTLYKETTSFAGYNMLTCSSSSAYNKLGLAYVVSGYSVKFIAVPTLVESGWLSGWSYRKQVRLYSNNVALEDYQVKFAVQYGSGTSAIGVVYLDSLCRSDFGDIRFVAYDGVTQLPYWIESYTSGSVAYVWVRMPYIPSSSNDILLYIYYGKSDATTTSNGEATFLFFDDFVGTALDTSKWDVLSTSGGSYSVSGGILTITTQSDGSNWKDVTIKAKTTFSSAYEVVAKVKWTYASEHESWIMNYYADASNWQAIGYRGYADVYPLRRVFSGTVYDTTYSLANDNPSNYEFWCLSLEGSTLRFGRATSLTYWRIDTTPGATISVSQNIYNINTPGLTVGIRDTVKGSSANYFYIDYIFVKKYVSSHSISGIAWG